MAIAAATWVPIDRVGTNQAITDTSATKQHAVGARVRCRDMSSAQRGEAEFQYARGVASVVAGDMCALGFGDDAAVRAIATTSGQCGVALAAVVADNYGWFQIYGRAIVNVSASFADDLAVYSTATAGEVDDAVVAGSEISGARSAGAIDTGKALIDLNYPSLV